MYVCNRRIATLLAGWLVLLGSSLLAQDSQPASQKRAGQTPTLAEIAKANEAAWEAIKSVDMEYVLTVQCVENGKTIRETQSPAHWARAGHLERLRRYPATKKVNWPRLPHGDRDPLLDEAEDYLLDGKTVRHLRDSLPERADKGELSCCNQQGLHAEIRPATSRLLITQRKSPELLRYLRFWDTPPLTLSEVIASWQVSLQEKQTSSAGDTLWLIHAEYPAKNGDDKLAGSYLDIQVNADKGFLTQKVLFYENHAASKDGKRIGVYYTLEVEEFHACPHGEFFPKRVKYHLMGDANLPASKDGYFGTLAATKLSVNSPLPADAFAFRFPKGVVVQQFAAENAPARFLVWGADNKPAKEFNTAEEFDKQIQKQEMADLQQRVERNRLSKKPADLVERGLYCLQTKKIDEAVAAFSQAISRDSKSADALFWRGMAYLFYKQDSAKAAADLTECLRRDPGEENAAMYRCLRGLAYAGQKDGLDKAHDEMTEALRLDPAMRECMVGAYLVRSVVLTRKGKWDEALADAARALEVAPDCADAYAVRCYAYEKKGDQGRSLADRQAAKRLRAKASGSNELEADFALALHRCLRQLVPAME